MAMCSPAADAVFGPVVQGCRSGFDFTLTFEQSIFSIGVSGLLLLIAPFRVARLRRQSTKTLPHWLLTGKLVCLSILLAVQFALVVAWSTRAQSRTATSIPAAALGTLDAVVLGLLSILEHKRSARPSSITCFYLLFSTLLDLTQARTLWLLPKQQVTASLLTVDCVVKLAFLVLESWEKKSFLRGPSGQLPPEAHAGVLNTSIFLWINPLIKHGYHAVINVKDLFSTDEPLSSEALDLRIKASWERRRDYPPEALLRTLLHCLALPALGVVFPRLCLSAFRLSQPLLINRAIQLIEAPITLQNDRYGYGLIAATALVYIGIAVANATYQRQLYRFITMIRGSLVCLVYSRTLGIPADEAESVASITLMSTDVDRITTAIVSSHSLWAGPIEAGAAIYLLQRQLGVACIAPVVVSLACTCGALSIMRWASNSQKEWVATIQKRVATTAAVLDSIKDIKTQGLTDRVSNILHGLRVKELDYAQPFRRNIIWTAGISNVTMLCGPVLTFAVFVLVSRATSGSTLNVAQAFTSISLISLLSTSISELVQALPTFAAMLGCLSRIEAYVKIQCRDQHGLRNTVATGVESLGLDGTEMATWPEASGALSSTNDDCMVILKHVSIGCPGRELDVLNDINIRIRRGTLTVLMGPVGCGKTALAKLLLGEMLPGRGSVRKHVEGTAYCSQEPWLPNQSVRDTMLGGALFDEAWYKTVVQACALEQDFATLRHGDQTVIGSKGASLSGGQKQRVALARAVYARKQFLVLDSVFSGLDAKTDERIVKALFGSDGLLKRHGMTAILITHTARHARWADHVVVMNRSGGIVNQGRYEAVVAQDAGLLDTMYRTQDEQTPPAGDTPSGRNGPGPDSSANVAIDLSRKTGDISIYAYLIRSIGWPLSIVFLCTVLLYTLSAEMQSVLLGYWSHAETSRPDSYTNLYLSLYGMLAGLAVLGLVSLLTNMLLFAGPKMSIRLHEVLLKVTMSAPLHWFVSTDSGATLNRFSQDMSLIDMDLLVGLIDTAAGLSMAVIEAVLIALGAKWVALALPIIFAVVYHLQKIYLRTSRQLRHLDLEAKAPLYSHFLETCSGTSTIRAFGWQERMASKNRELLDLSQRPFYLLYCVQCWLGLVLDLIVAGVAVLLIALATQVRSTTSGGALGVALVNVLNFNVTLSFLIKKWTALETSVGAVARTKTFEREMASMNAANDGQQQSPPVDWPSAGEIVLEDVSVAYKPGASPVLQNISLHIPAGQRVGLLGRTGSGKSSLLLTLLRQTALESGSITIDGVDLCQLAKSAVCQSLISIPQGLFVLPGTVRFNADPFGTSSDETIAAVLHKVHLGEIKQTSGGLDVDMANVTLSRGQQQLFAVARALCRKEALKRERGLLLLDEVTSQVDVETEQTILRVLDYEFHGWTVLNAAHRLEAVRGYDRVVVLDKGRFVEDRLLA